MSYGVLQKGIALFDTKYYLCPNTKAKHNMRAIIYARVSTTDQDTQRQIDELTDYAMKNEMQIVEVITDKESGLTNTTDRVGAASLLESMRDGKADVVLVHEISRLGRSAIDVQTAVNKIVNQYGADIHVYNTNMRARKRDGQIDPHFKIIMDMLANFAEMSVRDLRDRVKSGMAAAKRRGKHIGRPKGSKEARDQFLAKHKGVRSKLKAGRLSVREIAKLENVSPNTVMKAKKLMSA